MKQLSFLLFFALILVSCGTDSHHFKIDGRLIHLNQGEFYIYSIDGIVDGIDTIKISGGRFAYEIKCDKPAILMIVFPNFFEQPIFAEPGKEVSIHGDASHLKEMEVEGTDENELMGKFRQQIVSASPPEIIHYAEQFIKDHPASMVGVYLLSKYFMQTTTPDQKKTKELIKTMLAVQPKNETLIRFEKLAEKIGVIHEGNPLPSFSGYDINGHAISSSMLSSSPVSVIHVWASWNFESVNMLQQLRQIQREQRGKLKILAVSVDAKRTECRQTLNADSLSVPVVCDGNMFEGPVISKLGVTSVPDNILLKNGKVIAQGLNMEDLRKKIEDFVK